MSANENLLNIITSALEDYNQKWDLVTESVNDTVFFRSLKPIAVGWKVVDRAAYTACLNELHDMADKIIETWMNGRWIAKIHLRNQKLSQGVEIIKIMERRPSSRDAVGLDHVDFFSSGVNKAESILKAEPSLEWSEESNDSIEGYEWLSIWFAETEAKLKADTVFDIVAFELTQLSSQLKTPIKDGK